MTSELTTLQQHVMELAHCTDGPSCSWSLTRGLLIGLAIAFPVGPMGALCVQYALHRGFMIALFAGLGAALADVCFGLLAGLGFTAINDWILLHRCWIQITGGIFLMLIGGDVLFRKLHVPIHFDVDASPLSAMLSAFILTLANPLTLFVFIALFSYFDLYQVAKDPSYATMTILGIFIGSMVWWALIAATAATLRKRFNPKALAELRSITAAILVFFGVMAILKCL